MVIKRIHCARVCVCDMLIAGRLIGFQHLWDKYIMKSVEQLLLLGVGEKQRKQRFVLDTLIAAVGALLVTGFIYLFKLYPKIPNISFLYLLVVLALASTRGLYAAIVTSLIAFLS